MLKYFKTQDKEIVKNSFTVRKNSHGIVEVMWDNKVNIITLDQLIELKTVLKQINKGKKVPLLIFVNDCIEVSKEAREYVSTETSAEYTLANAVILDNLAKRLIFNFLMKISRPPVPTKSFSNVEDATRWLKEISENCTEDQNYILN